MFILRYHKKGLLQYITVSLSIEFFIPLQREDDAAVVTNNVTYLRNAISDIRLSNRKKSVTKNGKDVGVKNRRLR